MKDTGGPGIVPFEVSGSQGHADEIMAEWGDKGQDAARESLYIDFGFLDRLRDLPHPRDRRRSAIAPASAVGGAWRRSAGAIVGFGAIGAGFDALENICLLLTLGEHGSAFPVLATIFASIKFFFTGVAVLYLFVGVPMWVAAPRARSEQSLATAAAALPFRGGGVELLAEALLRGVERDLRHAARAHAGARQARGDARPARAAAPARRAAADRARLGDAAAAGARRLGRARRRARPAHATRRVVEHSDGRVERVALTPDRPVGEVTRELLAAVADLVGPVEIDPTPQEVPWTAPLDEDDEHATYDPDQVAAYFAAATRAALVLAAFRAPYRGRSTPVNAWWGSFDLAVNLFSGEPAEPPSSDFIMRNAMDAQEVAVGWWPGDARYPQGRLLRLRPPGAGRVRDRATLAPAAARWDADARRVRPRLGRRDRERRPARDGARVRPLGVPPRLPGLRLGRRAGGERRRHAAAGQLAHADGSRTSRGRQSRPREAVRFPTDPHIQSYMPLLPENPRNESLTQRNCFSAFKRPAQASRLSALVQAPSTVIAAPVLRSATRRERARPRRPR